MPKQVLPTPLDIEKISRELGIRGFTHVFGLRDFYEHNKDIRLIPPLRPRPDDNLELGFTYRIRDLTVTAWTSWAISRQIVNAFTGRRKDFGKIIPLGWARNPDSGWIVIEQANNPVKYYLPLRRTAGFVSNLLMDAKIARVRVHTRPTCTCDNKRRPANLTQGYGRGSRYWRCGFCRKSFGWDTPEFLALLPTEAVLHLKRRRGKRGDWQDKCRAAKKPIRSAMMKRKKWREERLAPQGF